MEGASHTGGAAARAFLSGGGEMGALIRAHDWSATPLGRPETWPQPLRTAVRLMLNTGHPVYIFWGPQATTLYNDAYSQTLGVERHPGSLGRPGREVWDEIWGIIGWQIEQVMQGRGATWHENQLIPTTRNGRLEDVYWTYSYSPIDDEAAPNGVGGVLVLCTETTRAVQAERRLADEAARQRRLFEQAPGFVCVTRGPEHVYEFVNDAHRTLFNSGGWIGKPLREAFPDIAGQGFYELMDHVYATGERQVFKATPVRFRTQPDGAEEERLLDFIYEPVMEDDGRVTGIFCEGFDVTETHRSEQALRENEARQRTLAEQLSLATDAAEIGLWDVDLVNNTLFWPMRLKTMFGIASDRPVTLDDFYAGLHPDDRARVEAAFAAALDPQRRRLYDVEYRTVGLDDGRLRWVAAKGRGVFDEAGRCVRAIGTAIDITKRRKGEAAFAEQAAELQAIFDAVPAAIWIARDAQAAHIDGNAFSRALLRVAAAENMSLTAPDGAAPGGFRVLDAAGAEIAPHDLPVQRAARGETVTAFEEEVRFDDGHSVFLTGNAQPLFDADGRPRGAVAAFADITERKKAEQRLRELNETLERRVEEALAERRILADTVETTDAFIQVLDPEYRFLAVNRASADEFERLFAVRPKPGDRLFDIIAGVPQYDAVRALWRRALAGESFTEIAEFEEPQRGQCFYEMKFNALRDPAGRVIGAYQFVYDVTDRLRDQQRLAEAEEHLRQAQKMEAIGQLTGGVAHDFNNLLMVITGGLSLLERQPDGERRQRVMDGMKQAAARGASLSRQLLAFARRQPLKAETVDLAAHIGAMRDLLDRTLRGDVEVRTFFAPDLWPIDIDPAELELAILNLCVNARDAMPRGGVITIRAENRHGLHQGDLIGDFVELAVSDTGAGMTRDVLARAFEPFFTTKEIGKGSGLGLAQVYGFAKQSGGGAEIVSEPGAGAQVRMYLPRSGGVPAARGAKAGAAVEQTNAAGHVLLVEDDDEVAALIGEMLRELGYKATRAASAKAALGALGRGADIDIVFSDVMMPGGMDGVALAREVRRRRPGLPVLLTSGYAESARARAEAEGVGLLPKPYAIADLAAALRQAMGGKAKP